MMLHEFLTGHREQLIRKCREKVAKRYAPAQMPQVVDHGVPLFLQQRMNTLQGEQPTTVRVVSEPGPSPVATDIGRAATLHGTELLRLGYSVDQVVHHYGDVCQAVDEAIADAVMAFGDERENAILNQTTDLHQRLGVLAESGAPHALRVCKRRSRA